MLFSNLKAKSINFVIAARQVIWTEEIGTISIPLVDGDHIKLHNITLAPECDSNLISLGQLCEARIIYHDNPSVITLTQQ